MYHGIGIIVAGIIAFYLPLALWIVVLLGILALWMFASAIILLIRARKGRAAIPEGFTSRVLIAVLSLLLGVLIFLDPMSVLLTLMAIVGVIAFLLGLMLSVNGFRLRTRMIRT